MWMSVPQMLAWRTRMRTSLGPTSGTGTSFIQMPGSRLALTSALMSVDDSQRTTDGGKGGHGGVQLLRGVRGRHLGADACLSLRHHREAEAHHVDALLQHAVREGAGQLGVSEHDGNNRVLAGHEPEAELAH